MKYYTQTSKLPMMAQLQQLTHLTWDGDLMSKADRNQLVTSGLVQRINGWNIITLEGIKHLEELKILEVF